LLPGADVVEAVEFGPVEFENSVREVARQWPGSVGFPVWWR